MRTYSQGSSMRLNVFSHCFVIAAICAVPSAFLVAQAIPVESNNSRVSGDVTTPTNAMAITADLTDAPRKLLHAEIEIPVKPGPFTFTAAKWIPGAHSPAGMIADITGLSVTGNGQRIPWQRDDVDLYAFHVVVPNGVTRLHIHDDFLATTKGVDVAPNLAELEWDRLLLYPADVPVEQIAVQPTVIIPADWNLGTALKRVKTVGRKIDFEQTTIRHLEDSPVLTGRYFREIPLAPDLTPHHFLDVAADSSEDLDQNITPKFLAALNKLIPEAWAMYGSHHYDSYHFFLTLSEFAGRHGQEHQESSNNGGSRKAFSDPAQAVVNGELLPHEFSHSWNGKYRRPVGLNTPDFATPMKGNLLWVYEGLTRLLGDVLAVRAGLETPQDFREALASSAGMLDEKPGRVWRSIEDSAVSAPVQGGSWGYSNWRRSFDFYGEGELLWLNVDMQLRELTNGQKSLNDFCLVFLGKGGNTGPITLPYDFDDLIAALNQVHPYPWASFLQERITSLSPHANLDGITEGGWKLVYAGKASSYEKADMGTTIDAYFSLGLLLSQDGTICDVRFFSPAFEAELTPGEKVVKINGRAFSSAALEQGLTERKAGSVAPDATKPLSIVVEIGGSEREVFIDYHDGQRFPVLERDPSTPDFLDKLLEPLTK